MLEKTLPLILEKTHVSIAAWVAEQSAIGHVCQCGCGQRIEVRPHHRKIGVPLLTVREAADALGVSEIILRRLDAEVIAGTHRAGIRFFAPGDIETLRKVLDGRRAKRKGSGAPGVVPETAGLSAAGTRRRLQRSGGPRS